MFRKTKERLEDLKDTQRMHETYLSIHLRRLNELEASIKAMEQVLGLKKVELPASVEYRRLNDTETPKL